MRHPQTVVTGTVLQRDVEALLVELGIPATTGVMERVWQYTQEFFGTSEGFQRVVPEMVGDLAGRRFRELSSSEWKEPSIVFSNV